MRSRARAVATRCSLRMPVLLAKKPPAELCVEHSRILCQEFVQIFTIQSLEAEACQQERLSTSYFQRIRHLEIRSIDEGMSLQMPVQLLYFQFIDHSIPLFERRPGQMSPGLRIPV